jgi:hypothetical protein
MQLPKDINEYLRARASELAERILRTYPPLHGVDDPGSLSCSVVGWRQALPVKTTRSRVATLWEVINITESTFVTATKNASVVDDSIGVQKSLFSLNSKCLRLRQDDVG